MNRRGLSAYKSVRKKTYGGMSQHALTMSIYKEIYKNLEVCNAAFVKKTNIGLAAFLNKKGVTLTKVVKCTTYMIDTADRSADQETVQLYDRIYHYILDNALIANKNIDHEAVKRALFMSKELINIWDSIPERYK
ncbi:flagellar protein FliS [Vibrio crassostreae]|uniref:flagellar protein FliS n=1 Tax=Vibrio crassostreae TaxID=246167 RepID=UPI001B3042CB|nr:flagellar protein FliS [Vibrio crassostreae]